MSKQSVHIKPFGALMITSVMLFASSAFCQSPSTVPLIKQNQAVVQATQSNRTDTTASEPAASKPENKATPDEPRRGDLQSEVDSLKAENAAVRELLQKMAEQQKTLLEQVDRLQRRLDGGAAKDVAMAKPATADAVPGANPALATPAPATNPATGPAQPATASAPQGSAERYFDGIVIWKTPDDAKVPFLLRLNNNTQIRYLNTLNSPESFTDHLGNVREVHNRNDITVNRSMFILGGYIFDKRVRYSLTVWTSAGAASIVVAGNIGWEFNKHLTLMGGYTGVPGSRSLVNTFSY